jgi:hypothetical protein
LASTRCWTVSPVLVSPMPLSIAFGRVTARTPLVPPAGTPAPPTLKLCHGRSPGRHLSRAPKGPYGSEDKQVRKRGPKLGGSCRSNRWRAGLMGSTERNRSTK